MGILRDSSRDDGHASPAAAPASGSVPAAAAASPVAPASAALSAPHQDGGSELQRRRDRLAEQVTELHWDLGGLAYEMAIRDHFRLDVLVRRAAALQERDAELAEVERLLRMEENAVAGSCPHCAAPHSRGALFCWQCGATLMERAPSAAAGSADGATSIMDALLAPDGASSAGSAFGPRPRELALTLPSRKVSALLVLVFLGFGTLLGGVANSPVSDTLAASRQPVKLVLPGASAPAPTSPTPTASAPSSPPASSEVPESESTPTPVPAAAPSTPRAPAKAPVGSPNHAPPPTGTSSEPPAGGGSSTKLPAIKHVFVIMLSEQPYAAVFGPASSAPYLSQTLERKGELLVHYDAVAHEQLANELALISGQGPTAETAANCPNYSDVAPASVGADEQVLGSGCVYPATTPTLASQLTAKHLTWRAYVEGIDEAGAPAGACAHPALGQPDPSAAQTPGSGGYATFLNPFVYFHSVIDSPACAAEDVGLASLRADLGDSRSTPSLSYIVPDRCHDGNPTPCSAGAPAGLAPADGFLSTVVPEIMGSKAYADGGLLVITVDEAPSSGEFADSSSCCSQPSFPNPGASKTVAGLSPRGGGTVGALLLSPFIKGATTSQEPYNHFSLLRTIEDLFGLKHLGYAALPGVKSLQASMFSAPGG